ncbi:MAG: hypothetical protein RXR21_04745 [Nitrososphaeria archaeon]
MPRAQEGSEPVYDIQDLVHSALQLVAIAKRLGQEAREVLERYGRVNAGDLRTSVLILSEAYRVREQLARSAEVLKDQMVRHLIELASLVPMNREDFIRALNILYSLNPYEPESILATVANDGFLEVYTSLVLGAITARTGAPPAPVFVPIPLQQPQATPKP